jgi:hypothetical protein
MRQLRSKCVKSQSEMGCKMGCKNFTSLHCIPRVIFLIKTGEGRKTVEIKTLILQGVDDTG